MNSIRLNTISIFKLFFTINQPSMRSENFDEAPGVNTKSIKMMTERI